MILSIEIFRQSYYLLLYSPFWILNRTKLKFDFQVIEYQSKMLKNLCFK